MTPLLTFGVIGFKQCQHLKMSSPIQEKGGKKFKLIIECCHFVNVNFATTKKGKTNFLWMFILGKDFQMMVEIGNMAIMSVLSNTTNMISEGEVQQLINAKNPDITREEYYTVVNKKTAALFAAACQVSAVVAEKSDAEEQALQSYGQNLLQRPAA